MYYNPRRLLDQITLIHGPHDVLSQYFFIADTAARDCGVRLRLRTDFERLIDLNEQNRDSWPPLSPIFNPMLSNLRIDTAFWIEGIDETGETVATNAGRLYHWPDTTLADELRSLRVFYEDPEPHIAAGESVQVTAPSANKIRGEAVFTGAMWVRPDYRRHGLTKIIPRISRTYAYTRWGNPLFWALIEPDLHRIGVTRAYGPWHHEEGVLVRLASWRGELPFRLLTATSDTMIADIASLVDQATSEIARWTDTPRMNSSSSAPRQGISMRS
jgi:hypothetical protein